MKKRPHSKPVVLVLAGHDPCGGAGIQADIEAIGANGCHAATVLTAMTIQNTSRFIKYIPVKPADFIKQIKIIRSDMKISACKIGLLGDAMILRAVITGLQMLGDIPLVLDPVINAGSGKKIMPAVVQHELNETLLPYASVITPNSIEARALAGVNDLNMAAERLLRHGCKAVMITGAHEPGSRVINTLYQSNLAAVQYSWPRLPGNYHGSGCTLSSAIAAHLAHGANIKTAVKAAQKYTLDTLNHAVRLGKKQFHPDRFCMRKIII